MYSRSYYPDSDISIPEKYDGNAFSEEFIQGDPAPPKIEPVKSEMKFSPRESECRCQEPRECVSPEADTVKAGRFGIDFHGLFGGLFGGGGLSSLIPKSFGTEEILIIGIALFLLLSPNRDIECALLILALIFVK